MTVCKRCVMDDVNDPDISFDGDGFCCYCRSYYNSEKRLVAHGEEGRKVLISIFERIKRDGHGKEHDCILGLSGGTDSSYVAYIGWKAGLHVILGHLDNHWDTKSARAKVIKRLGLSLEEFDLIMKQPPRSHLDYPNEQQLYYLLRGLNRAYRAVKSIL
ncbi:hypothetical protein MUP77_21885 [Candidatus Bathyarchaeota archaeon]|nr:hypothetical protein [Candidatus Bathyarchaeota archaeon]